MADTVASLLNSLRMVWVTSRQVATDERTQALMEKIAYQVCTGLPIMLKVFLAP